ncbi:hypothetical protein GCM10029992_23610 [Glycomyces albus]
MLVGPASSGSGEQMKVRSSTRATSVGSVRARNESGLAGTGSSVPKATSSAVSRRHSASDPSHQTTWSGSVRSATSPTQASRRWWRVGGSVSPVVGFAVVVSVLTVAPSFVRAWSVAGRVTGRDRWCRRYVNADSAQEVVLE